MKKVSWVFQGKVEGKPAEEARSSFSINAICKAKKFLKLRKAPSVEEMKNKLDDLWKSLCVEVSSHEEEPEEAEEPDEETMELISVSE